MANKIAMATVSYAMAGIELDRSLRGIQDAGYEYIELSCINLEPRIALLAHAQPERMSSSDIEALRKKISNYGLECICITGHVDLAGTPEAKDLLKKRIDLAESLGARYVNTGVGEATSENNIKRFYKAMNEIADYCKRKDVIVALETLEHLIGTGKMCVPVMKRIDSPFIRICYDPADVRFYHGVDPVKTRDLEEIVSCVATFHVKDHKGGKGDYNFPPIGEGEIDFKYLFNVLGKSNYEGPYIAEIEFTGICEKGERSPELIDEAAVASLKNIRKLL